MDLITLEEYKTYKNIKNPEKDDVLSAIISSVSNLIKVYCGRSFIDHFSTPKVQKFTVKKGRNALILDETPVIDITAVDSAGVSILDDVTVDSTLGIVNKDIGHFTEGTDVITVLYTGGFEETPSDIKLACFELVDYYYNSEHKAKKSFGGTSIEYQATVDEWPFHIQGILDMYRDL